MEEEYLDENGDYYFDEDEDFYAEDYGEDYEEDYGEDYEETETEEEPDESLMEEYLKYWKETYDPDRPGLPLPAQAQRERLLKKKGEWERMQAKKIPQIQEKITGKRVKTYAKKLIELGLCQNLSNEERKNIPNSLLISLRMVPKDGNPIRVCYNILNLYPYLIGKYGNNPINWRDPTTKETFSQSQRNNLVKLFNEKIKCNRPQLMGQYEVNTKNGSQGKILIPSSLYEKIIEKDIISPDSPLIFQLINVIEGKMGQRVEDSQIIFAGLEDLGYHDKQTIALPKDIMKELKVQNFDTIKIQDCLGLPVAKSVIFYPTNQDLWNRIPDTAIDSIRNQLEDIISNNYYALQVSQIIPIEWDQFIIDLQVAKLTDLLDEDVLFSLVSIPGGLELELGFTDTLQLDKDYMKA